MRMSMEPLCESGLRPLGPIDPNTMRRYVIGFHGSICEASVLACPSILKEVDGQPMPDHAPPSDSRTGAAWALSGMGPDGSVTDHLMIGVTRFKTR